MSDTPLLTPTEQSCWTRIGVWGDSTCPELRKVGHCRNCDVYTAGGRRLLDRPAPDDYIDSWTEVLAQAKDEARASTVPHLVFRVGQTWLAVRAVTMREIMLMRVVRSVPHRPREILLGLVTVRGEIHPCVSLHSLFGEERATTPSRAARLLVARWAGEVWVFPADEVDGMHDVDLAAMEALPATLAHTGTVYSTGLFTRRDRAVAVIDEDLLFSAIRRRIA